MNTVPRRLGKTKDVAVTIEIEHYTEGLNKCTRKGGEAYILGKKEVKLSLLMDNIIMYAEMSWKSTSREKNDFSKVI